MKKRSLSPFLIATIAIACFSSCKKDSGTTATFQFQAKFDGTEQTFSNLTTAVKSNLGAGIYSLIVAGTSSSQTISLTLWSNADDFTAGKTFTQDAVAGTENVMSYGPTGSSDPTQDYFTYYMYSSVTESFNCAITEATSTGIKGTFSGTLYQNVSGTINTIQVTDGTFYAKF